MRIRGHTTAAFATRHGVTGPTPIASSRAKASGTVSRLKKGLPTDLAAR